jgi:hypothetical protein
VSAIVSGTAAVALVAGLAAGLAAETGQVRPYVEVRRHSPPGPALIETLETSAGGANTLHALEPVADEISGLGDTVSDICQSEASSSVTLDAVLCTLSGNVESLLEPLLAGLRVAD